MTVDTDITRGLHFAIDAGGAELFEPDRPAIAPDEEAPHPRGLALKEIVLHRSYEGRVLEWFSNPVNDVFFVSVCVDGSGNPPAVFPTDKDSADQAWVPMRKEEPVVFTLGEGVPLWLPAPIVRALAVTLIVADSDSGLRSVGDAISKATKDMGSDENLLSFLATLASNPTGAAADVALKAVARATHLVANAIAANSNDHIGLYRGVFSATGSWEGKLHQDQAGASVTLAEFA